jgi:hypothetical protein
VAFGAAQKNPIHAVNFLMGGFWESRRIPAYFLIPVEQPIQLNTVGQHGWIRIAAGGVNFIESLPSGGDFLFQEFDCFGVSVRHGF